ncbi:hypothetical protein ACWGEU_08095 [Streptomyces goshikiensis]
MPSNRHRRPRVIGHRRLGAEIIMPSLAGAETAGTEIGSARDWSVTMTGSAFIALLSLPIICIITVPDRPAVAVLTTVIGTVLHGSVLVNRRIHRS